jgi:hypothetical protein
MGLEILETLRTLGVTVEVIGPDRLRCQPASRIPQDLASRIREAKPEILAVLRRHPSTCAPSCCQIGPDRWVHHPWRGCTTRPLLEDRLGPVVDVDCWHCHGSKLCRCIACWSPQKDGAGQCVVCHGSGIVAAWVQ